MDYALANRLYKFVVDSTWGPLSSVVHNYIMIRAEKNKQTIEPMAYKLAFSFSSSKELTNMLPGR